MSLVVAQDEGRSISDYRVPLKVHLKSSVFFNIYGNFNKSGEMRVTRGEKASALPFLGTDGGRSTTTGCARATLLEEYVFVWYDNKN